MRDFDGVFIAGMQRLAANWNRPTSGKIWDELTKSWWETLCAKRVSDQEFTAAVVRVLAEEERWAPIQKVIAFAMGERARRRATLNVAVEPEPRGEPVSQAELDAAGGISQWLKNLERTGEGVKDLPPAEPLPEQKLRVLKQLKEIH